MDPITIALGLAKIAPTVIGWLSGDEAEEKAERLIGTAKQLTGIDDPQDAVNAIHADPALQVKMQELANNLIVTQMQEETKRLQTVNATMQAEYASDDMYVKRWRPTMGYAMTFTWVLVFIAISYVIAFETDKAPSIISAVGQLTGMWSVALAVLGVSVYSRSKDKQTKAGGTAAGVIDVITSHIKGGE